MIRVKQTICTPDDGNCLAACCASILENNIDDYPTLPKGTAWKPVIKRWLRQLGYDVLFIDPIEGRVPLCGYHLIIGQGQYGLHCIVGLNGRPYFDPSPYREDGSCAELKDPFYGLIYKMFL